MFNRNNSNSFRSPNGALRQRPPGTYPTIPNLGNFDKLLDMSDAKLLADAKAHEPAPDYIPNEEIEACSNRTDYWVLLFKSKSAHERHQTVPPETSSATIESSASPIAAPRP